MSDIVVTMIIDNSNALKEKGERGRLFEVALENDDAKKKYEAMYEAVYDLMLKKEDASDKAFYAKKEPTRSIIILMDGKDGTYRGTILGKRADFSGRTVLVGDFRIPMDYIGLPFAFAEKITIPELVTEQNIDEINMMINAGIVKTMKNQRGVHQEVNEESIAEVGFTITRKITYGDPVVFSRQPVLHKGSIMCYKAKNYAY